MVVGEEEQAAVEKAEWYKAGADYRTRESKVLVVEMKEAGNQEEVAEVVWCVVVVAVDVTRMVVLVGKQQQQTKQKRKIKMKKKKKNHLHHGAIAKQRRS